MTRALEILGLVLVVIVAKLAEWDDSEDETSVGRFRSVVAQRAIDGIAVIGWAVDRLPLPGALGFAGSASPTAATTCQPV